MERKTVSRILIGTGALIGSGAAIFGVIRLSENGENGSDGQVFNPSGSAATRTVDGTVIVGGDEPTPTPTETPRPGDPGYISPTAISISQSPRPEGSATPTPRPSDIWTPPGTIWTPEPTDPPYITPQPTLPPTVIWTPEPTPQPTAVPTPEPTAPVVEGPNYEWANQLTNLINQERINNGLNALNVHQALVSSAFEYAEFLIENDVFGHDLDGQTSHDRAEKHGYIGRAVGENLADGSSAETIMQGWINSPGHYALILNSDLNDIGLGCYQGYFKYSNGDVGFTTICASEFGIQ